MARPFLPKRDDSSAPKVPFFPSVLVPTRAPALTAFAFLGSMALAAAWTWGGGATDLLLWLGILAFLAVIVGTQRFPRVLLACGSGALALFVAGEALDLTLPLTVPQLLTLEAVFAVLPLAGCFALMAGIDGATRTRIPMVARIIAIAFLLTGSIVRWGEIAILTHASTTIPTVQYALRDDLACVLWGFGAMAMAAGYAFQLYRLNLERAPTHRRVPLLVTGTAVLLVAGFLGLNLGAVVEAKVDSADLLHVGVHTNDVRNLDPAVTPNAHLEIPWDRVERDDGRFSWAHFDDQVRVARERGIGLYLLVNTYPPSWLVEKYPDAVMVDQWGSPFTWPDEAPGTAKTRIWDMSFHHAGVMAAKTRFVAAALDRYGNESVVRFVSIQNEPSYPHDFNLLRYASYDPHTERAFVRDLRAEYDDDLDAAREALDLDAATWADVKAPKVPGSALWDRWSRFREDSLVGFVRTLADTARDHTDKPITAKLMAHFLTRFSAPQAALSERALRGIIEPLDVVSLDLYPASTSDLERSLQYFQHLAEGRPLVVAEFNLLLGMNLPTSGATLLRSLNLLERYTDWVFLFTEDEHYLYSLDFSEGSLVRRILDIYRAPGWDPRIPMATLGLVMEDAIALTNIYPAYVLVSQVLSVPVVPWPFLALAMIPAMPTGSLRPRTVLVIRVGAAGLLVAIGYLT
ncbi:MAG TPA: beta-galactosidase, partial [Candidatus Thermoplasmatota archaeon]|nr:beta-galactosidase [Candidatus Thermoplasmatota archaeon]